MEKKLYTIEHPELIKDKLSNLQRKPGLFTADEIVNKYSVQIKSAIDMGYNFKEIAQIFNENNCKISTNALKIAYEKSLHNKVTKSKKSYQAVTESGDINDESTAK